MSQNRQIKPVSYFVFDKIKREKCVWIGGVIALLILLGYKFITSDAIGCVCLFLSNFFSSAENFLKQLSYAYLGGWIIYVVTSVVSFASRSRSMLLDVCESIRYLKDTCCQLVSELNGNSNGSGSEIEKVVDYLRTTSTIKCTDYELSPYCQTTLIQSLKEIDRYLSDIQSNSLEYLSDAEVTLFCNIKHNKAFQEIRQASQSNNFGLFGDDRLKIFAADIVTACQDANELYETVDKRVYKKQV